MGLFLLFFEFFIKLVLGFQDFFGLYQINTTATIFSVLVIILKKMSIKFCLFVFYCFCPIFISIENLYIVERNGILFPKLFWSSVRKNCFRDWEKLLKIEIEGWEFLKFLKSLKQFIRTVKGQNNFWNRMLFWEVSQI